VCTKTRTPQDLKHEIEIACAAIPPATIQEEFRSLQYRFQQCIDVGGGNFERLCL
jgi:hypothetical protein